MTPVSPDDFCCRDHNGQAETDKRLERAAEHAGARGMRLTPVRKRTLEILLQSHGALGAYDVLEVLAKEGFGSQPPVAYRALNFLVEHGLAHRIRRLNAFTACIHPNQDHRPAFLICENCSSVTEAAGGQVGDALHKSAAAAGFAITRTTLEAVGLCRRCQGDA